ncbi:MAG: DUF1697 domain-containing protein [Oscillospiraceae bacterium]|jgi:uncharacterized protein (DUF1697 family)|nr:DUF1697 domain-containing protein [Oscillospiraceae bacterium]
MPRYIALLRGVNVGGNNKIAMPQLKAALEARGFSRVVTYINSGNVLLNSDWAEPSVRQICEETIQASFGLAIAVCVISAVDLADALAHAPVWWEAGEAVKHNAIFVIPPMTAADICTQVGETQPDYEQVACHGRVIFWSAPLKTFSRTRWSKITQHKAAYAHITIRNANTTRKLTAL